MTTPHVHPCPECYEDWPCAMDCSIEPELRRDNGLPSGSHSICPPCVREMKPCDDCGEPTRGYAGQRARCRDCWIDFMASKWRCASCGRLTGLRKDLQSDEPQEQHAPGCAEGGA